MDEVKDQAAVNCRLSRLFGRCRVITFHRYPRLVARSSTLYVSCTICLLYYSLHLSKLLRAPRLSHCSRLVVRRAPDADIILPTNKRFRAAS